MAKRGKKDCPNCNSEIGARTILCRECGYHYPSKCIRKDLLKKENKPKEVKTFTSGGQGRKECLGCHIFIGAVIKTCPKCGYKFLPAKKKVIKKKRESSTVEQIEPEKLRFEPRPYNPYPVLSPIEHAKRILNYGRDRAINLLNQNKRHKWSHVDWGEVEKGLEL